MTGREPAWRLWRVWAIFAAFAFNYFLSALLRPWSHVGAGVRT